jgi:hypothetical protein
MPAGVALSRMYRGMHHPTDLLGAALLTTLWIGLLWWVIRPNTPDAGPSAAGEDAADPDLGSRVPDAPGGGRGGEPDDGPGSGPGGAPGSAPGSGPGSGPGGASGGAVGGELGDRRAPAPREPARPGVRR